MRGRSSTRTWILRRSNAIARALSILVEFPSFFRVFSRATEGDTKGIRNVPSAEKYNAMSYRRVWSFIWGYTHIYACACRFLFICIQDSRGPRPLPRGIKALPRYCAWKIINTRFVRGDRPHRCPAAIRGLISSRKEHHESSLAYNEKIESPHPHSSPYVSHPSLCLLLALFLSAFPLSFFNSLSFCVHPSLFVFFPRVLLKVAVSLSTWTGPRI